MGSGRLALLRRKPGLWTPTLSLVLLLDYGIVGLTTMAAEVTQAPAPSAAELYTQKDTRDVVVLVEAAANEVRLHGREAFPSFRVKGSRWFQGDRYVFVLATDGNSVVYPPDPESEGLSFLGFQDLGGKPFGRQFLEVANSPEARGWVHYQWRKPNRSDRRPVWKSTYLMAVTAPSGQRYLVLSGLYEPQIERAFIVQQVDAAARLLQRQGRSAFETLRDRRGPYFFHDTYVFVDTPDGVEVLNPAFAEVEGRNILQLKDKNGKAMVRDYINLAMGQGSGWVEYLWPRPDASSLPERKTTYVRRVQLPDGETLIVGSGLYAP
jgi:signal transduction histidine kinase